MDRTRVDDLCTTVPLGGLGCQLHGIGDLKLFEPITMLCWSRYATAKSAVVYRLQRRKDQRIRVLGRTTVG